MLLELFHLLDLATELEKAVRDLEERETAAGPGAAGRRQWLAQLQATEIAREQIEAARKAIERRIDAGRSRSERTIAAASAAEKRKAAGNRGARERREGQRQPEQPENTIQRTRIAQRKQRGGRFD